MTSYVLEIGGLGIFKLLAEGLGFRERDTGTQAIRANAPSAPVESAKVESLSLLDRIDNWFWRRHQRSLEMRLAKAQDLCELERMMRGIERGDISFYP